MRDALHLLLTFIKWPLAAALLVLLPAAVLTLARTGLHMARQPTLWWPLWAGLGLFVVLWLLGWRRGARRSWLHTLEHELTHALFAVLTFNRVTRLTAAHGNGELEYLGRGNWLISLAPYFFPTFCVLPLLALQLAVPAALPWLLGALGFALAMHLQGTVAEIHWHQPDLVQHGRLASACILPGAFIWALVLVVAAVPGQWAWVLDVAQRSLVDAWQAMGGAGRWLKQTFAAA